MSAGPKSGSSKGGSPKDACASALKSAYLVFGDDDYLVEARVARLVAQIVSAVGGADGGSQAGPGGAGEVAVDKVDCEEAGLEGVVEELMSPSLFSTNKVIVLRRFRLSAENRIAKEIEKCLASGLAPGQYLVIEASKVDKRLKLGKMIAEAGGLVEERRPDDRGLRDWVGERFRELGKSAGPGVADLLIDLKGDDFRALASEIEKTAVYVGGNPAVTKADLQDLVGRSRTERIFELARHVIEGKRSEALSAVADLLDAGESGVGIVYYLGREIRWLIQIKLFLRGRPRLWDRGTTFPEFQRTVVPAFKAWLETCRIAENETCLRQKPYAAYMKFKEAEGCSLDRLLILLDRLVETNIFLVSKSVEHKDRMALEALVTAA